MPSLECRSIPFCTASRVENHSGWPLSTCQCSGFLLQALESGIGGPVDGMTEPAGKCLRPVDLVQVGIRFQEGLLGRVLGQVEIAKDRVRVAHSHVLEPLDQHSESIYVACLGLLQRRFQMFRAAPLVRALYTRIPIFWHWVASAWP